MKAEETQPANDPAPVLACERCGATGAVRVAGEAICMDCYHGAGACCAESEMEDPDFTCEKDGK